MKGDAARLNLRRRIMTEVLLFIDGVWRNAASGDFIPIINPVTEEIIGRIGNASAADIEDAAMAAARGFATWRRISAVDRATVMRKAATLVRERGEAIARTLTLEHGKPLSEARAEVAATADTIDWHADEGRRA
jgi:succinate-semialdehyde dehydrogenase/glutarate-semialdehyde dehydrogenase